MNIFLKHKCSNVNGWTKRMSKWMKFGVLVAILLCALLVPGRSDLGSCPALPTELVVALDMSEDVTPAAFERQRAALLSLLEDITVAESNCPTGARVAVVAYSAHTKYLVRFHDYRRKTQLLDAVRNVALERTSNRRQLGTAMRFVAHNVLKRVRSGAMMRKVAVFFSNGPSQDISDVVTAVMEYRALNVVPAIISTRNAPAISRAMEVSLTVVSSGSTHVNMLC